MQALGIAGATGPPACLHEDVDQWTAQTQDKLSKNALPVALARLLQYKERFNSCSIKKSSKARVRTHKRAAKEGPSFPDNLPHAVLIRRHTGWYVLGLGLQV